jgi:hypothetical protein
VQVLTCKEYISNIRDAFNIFSDLKKDDLQFVEIKLR